MRLAVKLVQTTVNQFPRRIARQIVQQDVADKGHGDLPVGPDNVRATDFGATENVKFEHIAATYAIHRIDRLFEQSQVFLRHQCGRAGFLRRFVIGIPDLGIGAGAQP
ncbi:hypothetical protein JZU54_07880, partial [bacterium]|nr:hypothetical protein [bacterium]